MRKILTFAAVAFAVASSAGAAPLVLDGIRDAAYGPARAVQTVRTGFGDNFNELDAAYALVEGGTLYVLFTGNLEANFNRLNVFFDTKAGGQNVLQNAANAGGTNPENDGWAGKHAGMTFDSGFEADYMLSLRNGFAPGARFDVGYAVVGGGLGNYLEASDVFGGSLVGSNASALANGIGVAFDNSNVAGITGGFGAADATAAQAVLTGIELAIPLAALGSPAGAIRISPMLNGSNHDYLSNQFLGGLPAGSPNLGGDGAGGFTGSLSGVDLNDFAGEQYFEVAPRSQQVPEPSTLVLMGGALAAHLVRRRRRAVR